MTWGEQTTVPESADWYNSSYIIAWGSNVPQEHVRNTTSLPKYATKALKPSPLPLTTLKWPNCATSGWHRNKALIAPGDGNGPCDFKRVSYFDNPSDYFINYCRRYSGVRCW
ncbi:hypothetical protein ACLB1M_12685 [Escherichia coli]